MKPNAHHKDAMRRHRTYQLAFGTAAGIVGLCAVACFLRGMDAEFGLLLGSFVFLSEASNRSRKAFRASRARLQRVEHAARPHRGDEEIGCCDWWDATQMVHDAKCPLHGDQNRNAA